MLVVILIVAALVRYWGIDFGLPNTNARPDEPFVVNTAVKFGTGDFNPHDFSWPHLYFYLLFGLFGLYFVVGRFIGRYTGVSGFEAEFITNPTNFYLIDRCFSALFGVATVWLIYHVTSQLFNKKTALVSALFLSLAFLHVRDSHFGTLDVAMTFWVTGALLFSLKSYQTKAMKYYILAGALAGLAASTKYPGGAVVVSIVTAHFFNVLEEKGGILKLGVDRRILSAAVISGLAFLIGTPFALFNFSQFTTQFMFEVDLGQQGHEISGYSGWSYHLGYSLWYGLGWPFLVAALFGILLLIKFCPKKAVIFLAFPVTYYLVFATGSSVFLRYMVPLIPSLSVTAAWAVVTAGDWLGSYISKPYVKHGLLAILVAITLYPSVNSVTKFNTLLSQTDNRLLAADWINRSLPNNSTIYQAGDVLGQAKLEPALDSLKQTTPVDPTNAVKLRVQLEQLQNGNTRGYNQWSYNTDTSSFEFNSQKTNAFPDYIITQTSPLTAYTTVPPSITQLLQQQYQPLKSFEAIDTTEPRNLFDQQDAFYMPYAGFVNIQRPGPNIFIFVRKP